MYLPYVIGAVRLLLFWGHHRCQICPKPPSTHRSMPVTKELSSDARKTAACAISAGDPSRPSGMAASKFSLANAAWATGSPSFILAPIGVSVGPGLKLFMRIRRSFRSLVQLRANDRTAALVAL